VADHVLDHVRAPRPQYCLRLDLLARRLAGLEASALLEVGPGAGDLAAFLLSRGHRLTLVEPSTEALDALARRFRGRQGVELVAGDARAFSRPGAFTRVLVCEVLEHVEDDLGLLRHLAAQLAPGGRLLGSVPAFARRWSAADEAVGHLRRYERGQLSSALEVAGLQVSYLACYGFPVANLLGPARALAGRLRLRRGAATPAARSLGSGLQPGLLPWPGARPWRWALAPALWLQQRFADRDWGTGWVFEARR
jgi:SAM-dependent methyltransferase